MKQLGAGPELFHCHATLTLEALMSRAVTPVGVGGVGVIQSVVKYIVNSMKVMYAMYVPLSGRETITVQCTVL